MLLLIGLSSLLVLVIFYFLSNFKQRKNLLEKHILISGGSSGIGLSVAKQTFAKGAKVTILARDTTKLEAAKNEIIGQKANLKDDIQCISVDVTGSKSSVEEAIRRAEETFGAVYMLVNCAGLARAAKIEDLSESDAKAMINVNLWGSFILTQSVVKSMKNAGEGIIVLVSSQGGLLGIFGYTLYAATKGAIIKLAESLHSELKPYNISVTVNCPPDTNTPGFEEENKTKPAETLAISESAALMSADDVARGLINDALSGKFLSSVGLEGFLLTTLCAGMSPITDFMAFVCQVALSGLFRIITAFYLFQHGQIIKNEKAKQKRD